MESVPNYTILEFLQAKDTSEFMFYMEFIKPENKFCNNVFRTADMTFNEFHTIIEILQNPKVLDIKELFVHLFRVRGTFEKSAEKMFLDESAIQFFKAKKFLENFIRSKLEYEKEALFSIPNDKMIEVNAYKRLAPYNVLMTKMRIGEQFSIDPEIVGTWKYTKVLNIMAVNTLRANIQQEINV